MSAKHHQVCYNTQSITDQLGRNLGRAEDDSLVFSNADITIILTSVAGVEAVRTVLHLYQHAAAASLKLTKSKVLPLGRWST